jgi:SAM-dependent methyltransferase
MDKWTSGAHYDQWMGRWSRLLAQEFLQWLELPAGLRWMDACCGSGVITEAIVERNLPATVVGVDASAEQITFARSHRAYSNVTFETADALALPFPGSSFDVVVCGLGLNFLPDPAKALDEFSRVARPGGTIAVYVWDYVQSASFLRYFWDAAIAIDGQWPSGHLRPGLPFPHVYSGWTSQPLRTCEAGRLDPASARSSDTFHQLRRLLGATPDRAGLRAGLSRRT